MSRGSPACPHRGWFDEAFSSLHRWVARHIAFAGALWAEESNAGAEGRRYQKIESPLINDVLRTSFGASLVAGFVVVSLLKQMLSEAPGSRFSALLCPDKVERC